MAIPAPEVGSEAGEGLAGDRLVVARHRAGRAADACQHGRLLRASLYRVRARDVSPQQDLTFLLAVRQNHWEVVRRESLRGHTNQGSQWVTLDEFAQNLWSVFSTGRRWRNVAH